MKTLAEITEKYGEIRLTMTKDGLINMFQKLAGEAVDGWRKDRTELLEKIEAAVIEGERRENEAAMTERHLIVTHLKKHGYYAAAREIEAGAHLP